MASASTSSVQKYFKYDAFLSFRGEDVRKTFVDHLYHALNQRGIITYKDDEKIEKGERINEQLIRAIEDSRLHIIVFSKNYASSSWCLDELVKIMQCQQMSEQTAYPIFYDVEPTDVRNQTGAVREAFAKVADKRKRKRTSEDADQLEKENADVGRWKNALKEAAGLAGWELTQTVDGHEAKFIEKIIEEISPKIPFINLNIDDNLVGMENRVKSVISSLKVDSDDVRMIGIKGMGGGGKTTLATAIFDHISIRFESKIFVGNVREGSKGSGLKELQKQVLQDALNDKNLDVKSVPDGKNKMKRMMPSRKALVVLDDVDDIDQLDALAGKHTWFKRGSRIIITTRDEQVLISHGVDFIYDVNLLSKEEALCLFSKHAFGREVPFHGYEELSRKVVDYAAGLPLTIKVLGSHLRGRSELEWEEPIERLKNIPCDKTLKRLEISYNGLEDEHKEIFLDVVCILKGKNKDDAIRILKSCGFYAQIGLRVLEQKSLITISNKHSLGCHDHIEEMGRNIVRRLHPNEPSKHSRLWIQEEIENILVNDLGTEETRSIILDSRDIDQATIMKGLRKMKQLRLLYVHPPYSFLKVDGVSECLPDGLQFLHWYKYPFRSLPESFQPNKLVCLEMCGSNISELWEGGERKGFNKLKFLDLSLSKLRTFDLSMTPYLEELNLNGCRDFVELRMPTGCLNLKVLDLRESKVTNFNLGMTPHLQKLNLDGCYNFVELKVSVECHNLKVLGLRFTKVSNLNLGMTPHLEELNLDGCHDNVELQLPVECLNLKVLELSGSMGNDFSHEMYPHLEQLLLYGCSYRKDLDTPLGFLKKPTIDFNLEYCLNFQYFCVDKKHESGNLDSVTKFKIHVVCDETCPQHPENNFLYFGFTCKYEEPRSSPSGNLEKLIYFDPCTCKLLDYFLATICSLQHLRALSLSYDVPRDLWRLQSLEELKLCSQWFQYLPDSICMLEHLKSLQLKECSNLEQLPDNICKLKFLKSLKISYCEKFTKLPEELGSIECLEELEMWGTPISRLPQSIYQLKGLRIHGFMGL